MIETKAYRFGRRRVYELLSEYHGLDEHQLAAIAHDMGAEFDRVLDGVVEALSQAVLTEAHARGERLTTRQARQRIRSLLEG